MFFKRRGDFMKKISLNIFILSFLIVSCGAPVLVKPVEPVFVEKERTIKKSFDIVWQDAVEWFATHNTPIKNLDKSSGLISTEYTDAAQYMNCGSGDYTFSGKVETSNHIGNFNVIIKKKNQKSTKVNINVFFTCTVDQYRYENLLSTNYVLVSSTKANCSSTGVLEKEILDFLSKKESKGTAGYVQALPKSELIGNINSLNASKREIVVSTKRVLKIGELVYVELDGNMVVMSVTYPMMTISGCQLEGKDAKYFDRLSKDMPVYKY